MPTYSYACTECGHAFDIYQSFTEETLTICPECQGKVRKKFNSVGVVFKGSGFYRTDSRAEAQAAADSRASTSSGSDAGSGGSSSSGGSSDAGGSGSSDGSSQSGKSGAAAGSSSQAGSASAVGSGSSGSDS